MTRTRSWPRRQRTLDFAQPVALMLLGIVHHIPDTDEAYSIVRRLMAALVPGSFLTINHSTSAVHGAAMEEAVRHWNRVGTPSMTLRSPRQIARFFRRAGPVGTRRGVVFTPAPDRARAPSSPPRWTNSAESRASRRELKPTTRAE